MGRLIAALSVAAYAALRWYNRANASDPLRTESTLGDVGQALDVLATIISFCTMLLDALSGIRSNNSFRFRHRSRGSKFGQETASDVE